MAVNLCKNRPHESVGKAALARLLPLSRYAALAGLLAVYSFPVLAQSERRATVATANPNLPDVPTPSGNAESLPPQTQQQSAGTVSGRVVDQSGTAVVGAHVTLAQAPPVIQLKQEVVSGEDGQFRFESVTPGPFQLTIVADGFATQTSGGTLRGGEVYGVPPITLALATEVTQVHVALSTEEIAQEEIKEQEKQRVFGVLPNFYVSYVPSAAPLTSKQKFGLAWKNTIDPVNFGIVGVIAGVNQATDRFEGYGQGLEGYARRYGAAYGDFVVGNYIGGAILPSLLKQDPRYFYKGTGSKRSRVLYAISMAVICKGDNGHWQANYSGILGSLAAGGISNLYYPEKDRSDAALTFENTLVGIGASAAVNILQEFVLRKVTPNTP
jgi:Carboxypeptidase regulatory-like domain